MFSRERGRVLGILVLVVALGVFMGTQKLRAADGDEDNLFENLAVFSDVLQKIRSEYVETVDSDKLIKESIQGMLSALDPYTQYLDTDQYSGLMQSTQGSFGGLGIEIAVRDGVLTVISPMEGTPAYRMGIQGGDRIIKIDGVSTKGITSTDAVKKLRGPRGTQVTITIDREGEEKPLDFAITRDTIRIDSVPYSFMLDDVGYIRISSFAEDTSSELDKALTRLEAMHPKGIIIDIRYNPGGLLSQAVATADLFVPEDRMIVSTRGRRTAQNREYLAHARPKHDKVPLVVMVNGASASASEILAGALQDWDLALIVGQRSFGKGSVQSVVPLKHGGGALKITTAKYFTPSGRCIHRDEKKEADHMAEAEEGDVAPDTLQLKPAGERPEDATTFKTFHGRTGKGGWGIWPDVTVEQPKLDDLAQELERRTLFFKFVNKYVSAHPELSRVPAPSQVPMDEFLASLKEEKLETPLTPEAIAADRDYINRAIRREFALRLVSHEEAVKVAAEGDVQLQEAVRLFERAQTLSALFELAQAKQQEAERAGTAPVAAAPGGEKH